jgi:hypothetical protein
VLYDVLLNVLQLPLEEFVESAEVEQPCRLPEEVGGLDRVDLIEHGVVVEGKFLEDANQEVVRVAGLAEGVMIDDAVFLANVESA